MSAVLNVAGRPIALGRCIVPLVEQCVEGLKDKLFVFVFNRLIYFLSSIANECAMRAFDAIKVARRRAIAH